MMPTSQNPGVSLYFRKLRYWKGVVYPRKAGGIQETRAGAEEHRTEGNVLSPDAGQERRHASNENRQRTGRILDESRYSPGRGSRSVLTCARLAIRRIQEMVRMTGNGRGRRRKLKISMGAEGYLPSRATGNREWQKGQKRDVSRKPPSSISEKKKGDARRWREALR